MPQAASELYKGLGAWREVAEASVREFSGDDKATKLAWDQGFPIGIRQISHFCAPWDVGKLLYFGCSFPAPPVTVAYKWIMGQSLCLCSLTQGLHTFVNSKGVDWVDGAAVEVLDKIKEAEVDKEEWLRRLREASGFAGDNSGL